LTPNHYTDCAASVRFKFISNSRLTNASLDGLVPFKKQMNAPNTNLENDLLAKLESEISEDQREIKIREKRMRENEVLVKALRSKLGVSGGLINESGYGNKSLAVRTAIEHITKPRFTQFDVEDEIKRLNSAIAVSMGRIKSVMWSLHDKKQLIRRVRDGNNRGQVAEFEKLAAPEANVHVASQQNGAPETKEIVRYKRALTAAQLETIVREKNRRVPEIASQFGIDEATLMKLINDPQSRVFYGTGGWLKIRQPTN
jgi:hypothetical protein